MTPQNHITQILALGIKRKELADMIPCSLSTIQMIANGTRGKNTSYVIFSRLVAILKTLSELKNSTHTQKVKK